MDVDLSKLELAFTSIPKADISSDPFNNLDRFQTLKNELNASMEKHNKLESLANLMRLSAFLGDWLEHSVMDFINHGYSPTEIGELTSAEIQHISGSNVKLESDDRRVCCKDDPSKPCICKTPMAAQEV